jgi:hypothetical protein
VITAPALQGWDNFYVIIGSAAAGLTGLTFVVIALAADADMARLSGLKIFVSPTVIHFSSALWIAALCNLPRQSAASLGPLMLASGAPSSRKSVTPDTHTTLSYRIRRRGRVSTPKTAIQA